MEIGLFQSSQLKYAKSLIGQTNHCLLTILVSLDTTENLNLDQIVINDYALKKWSPNYKTLKSFPLSKIFISNATLTWAIDALDAYYRIINTTPKLIQNKSLEDGICGAQSSVSRTHEVITNYFTSSSRFDCLIISLAITWRNNIVHHVAENEIFNDIKNELLEIEKNDKIFYKLNISKMIHNTEKKKSPSYNELNAIIRTILHYLETLDKLLIDELNINDYANAILKHHFFYNYKKGENIRLSNFLKKTKERRQNILKSLLLNYGFTDVKPIKVLNKEFFQDISNYNYHDLFDLLSHST